MVYGGLFVQYGEVSKSNGINMTAISTPKEMPWNRMTDYERAVCYYTLPKVINPISYGIIVAYAVCLFEAVGALVIGVVLDSRTWTVAGTAALVGIILFGMVVFTIRAFINEVRQREALAAARNLPAAMESVEDVPDPFAHHLLLAYRLDAPGTIYLCGSGESVPQYEVHCSAQGKSWTIQAAGTPGLHIRAAGGPRSFLFEAVLPGRFSIYAGEDCIGRIERRLSFTAPIAEVVCEQPEPRTYVVKQQSICCKDCIIGRIYFLRGVYYLDIDKQFFNDVLLAYFITRL